MTLPLELFRNSSVLVAWTVPNYDYYDVENLPFCPKQKSKTTVMNQIQKWFYHEDEWGKGPYLKKPSAPEFKTYVSWSRKILPKFPHQFFFWLFRVIGHTFGTHVVGIKRVTQFIASCWNLFNIEQFPNFKYIPQVSGRFPNFLVPDENFDFNQRQIEFTNIAVFLHTRTFSTKQMYKASCEHYVTAKKMWKNLHDNENERRRRHIFVAHVAMMKPCQ